MLWYSNSTITRLRDRLRGRAQRASGEVISGERDQDVAERIHLSLEYGPLCEVVYVVGSTDGPVSEREAEILKGALCNLTGDALAPSHFSALMDEAARNVELYGRDERLETACDILKQDPARAEVAFVLAAVTAMADDAITDEENELVTRIAQLLGISAQRAEMLFERLESEEAMNAA